MAATILIVDDHAPMRTLIQGIVAQAPALHVVGEAADGAEALRLTQELRPDLVLLDLVMPRVNGLEALQHIKAARPETTVIIMTVHSEDAYRRAAADGGADAFLVKKALMTGLLPMIRRLAEGQTTKAMTSRLGLSVKTVESRRIKLMRKLDIHEKATLAR